MWNQLLVSVLLLAPAAAVAASEFSYHYGDPHTPLNDGYIVSTSNATLYFENPVWLWKPTAGAATLAATTPAEIVYHFPFGQPTSAISLWMNMPTFHWSYSRGHNFLYGSTDGSSWTPLAELPPPAFGQARDLGTVTIPTSLLGATDLWLRAELYSYGSSASQGGVWTNTAQLSRWDVNVNNASFRLDVTLVPEPGTALLLLGGLLAFGRPRARAA